MLTARGTLMKVWQVKSVAGVALWAFVASLTVGTGWARAFEGSRSDCVLQVNGACLIADPNK